MAKLKWDKNSGSGFYTFFVHISDEPVKCGKKDLPPLINKRIAIKMGQAKLQREYIELEPIAPHVDLNFCYKNNKFIKFRKRSEWGVGCIVGETAEEITMIFTGRGIGRFRKHQAHPRLCTPEEKARALDFFNKRKKEGTLYIRK